MSFITFHGQADVTLCISGITGVSSGVFWQQIVDAKLVKRSLVYQIVLETGLDNHVVSFPGHRGFGVRYSARQSDRFTL